MARGDESMDFAIFGHLQASGLDLGFFNQNTL